MAAITQIKRDPEQACELNQLNVKHLEQKFEIAVKESKEAPTSISQSLRRVREVASQNEKEINSIQDRISYLRRVILSNRNDSNIFLKELEKLHQTSIEKKEQYQKNLQQQKSDQQEMENDLNTQISSAIHQLKALRFLQELRHQLGYQTRAVKKLIEEEKQLNSDDMTLIRNQIIDQREFYEKDLKTRLAQANQFARDFSDLHMELATTKIMTETVQNRKQLKEESAKTIEMLRENDILRKKHHLIDQQFKINQASLQNLHTDYSNLKLSILEYEEKMNKTLNDNKERIRKLKDEKDDEIGELKLRKEEALQRKEELKLELLSVQRELQKAEKSRSESSQKEYEVLDKMSQTATFILTAIDKSMEEDSFQKDDTSDFETDQISSQNNSSLKASLRNLKQKDVGSQKSELSRLMLRLQNISNQMKEDAMKTQSVLLYSNVEKMDAETQTDQSMKLDFRTVKIQPPSLLENVKNPRRKASVQTFRRAPPVYKKLFEKSKVPLSKKRTSLTRPIPA